MSDAAVTNYIAEACLRRIRDEGVPDDHVSMHLNRYPLIDWLRDGLHEDDIAQLCAVAQGENGPRAAFAISLLRNFSTRADIREIIVNRWNDEDLHIRLHVFWRLLDDATLDRHWHEQLFEFVLENREAFAEQQLAFMGGPSAVLGRVVCRLTDPSFPDSKKWAYLCCLLDSDDQHAAEALIRQAADRSTFEFTRRVAKELLSRFF